LAPWIQIPDWFSWKNQLGSIALPDLDGDGNLELIVFMIDQPGGPPRFITRPRLSTACLAQLLTGAIKVARNLREVCWATFIFPARWTGYATINRLGYHYRWSRIDVAIADSILEQHSGLLGGTSCNRNDGAGRLCVLLGHLTAIVAWVFIGLLFILHHYEIR
jgi:hypothetical protein